MKSRTFVSEDRCTFVRVYLDDGDDMIVEVATRPDPDAVWGPPVRVAEERWP